MGILMAKSFAETRSLSLAGVSDRSARVWLGKRAQESAESFDFLGELRKLSCNFTDARTASTVPDWVGLTAFVLVFGPMLDIPYDPG